MTYADQLRYEGEVFGVAKGKAEGKAEGKVEGRIEGRSEAIITVATKMLRRNFDPKEVAANTDLSLAQVLKLKQKLESRK